MNSFSKQPYESFKICGDFSNVMDTDETITLATSSILVEDKDGEDVSDAMVVTDSKQVDGQTLCFRVEGGTNSASPYKITYRAVTSVNEQYEVEQLMVVEED